MNRQQRRKNKPKPNPRNVPRTQLDVDKAYAEGVQAGVQGAMKVAVYILLDKHDMAIEEVQRVDQEMENAARELMDHTLSWGFINEVLRENGIREVRFV